MYKSPKNLATKSIIESVVNAYNARDFLVCQENINQLKEIDRLSYQYWQLFLDDFLLRLVNPTEAWESIYLDSLEILPSNHTIQYNSFCKVVFNAIKYKNSNEVLPRLGTFKSRFNKKCPINLCVGILCLLISEKKYDLCVDLYRQFYDDYLGTSEFTDFNLKTLPYISLSKRYVDEMSQQPEMNGISKKLLYLMKESYGQDSPEYEISLNLELLWNLIGESNFYPDIRFCERQQKVLQEKILSFLLSKKPFLLIRLWDGESYAFQELVPEIYFKSPEINLNQKIENIWWGKNISSDKRSDIINSFFKALAGADVIGFPGSIRLTQVLSSHKKLTPSIEALQIKSLSLLVGMQKFIKNSALSNSVSWVDEFINMTLINKDYLISLIDASIMTVVITCFDIPKNHFLNADKIKVVRISPESKISYSINHQLNHEIILDSIDNTINQVKALARPGVLVLVSAGFAGKQFLYHAKEKGAVALDIGSGIDYLLGYHSRSLEFSALYRSDPSLSHNEIFDTQ